MGKEKPDLDMEWEKRTLCSDGNCIGVIGTDGRCKECGRPFEAGDSTEEEETPGEEFVSEPEDGEVDDSDGHLDEIVEEDDNIDTEWDNRRLCSDGNCIGVIGPDGCCKECGKPG